VLGYVDFRITKLRGEIPIPQYTCLIGTVRRKIDLSSAGEVAEY
jgi:hypothetical protein